MREHLAVAAVLLVFGVAGCGSGSAGLAAGPSQAGSSEVAMRSSGPIELRFGQPHRFADGLRVTASEPKVFVPSRTAYPRAPQAVAFQIIIRNDADRLYRLSDMSITLAADGAPAQEIVDSAQGFHGVTNDTDLAPTREIVLTLAYALPARQTSLALTIQPELGRPGTAYYVGRA